MCAEETLPQSKRLLGSTLHRENAARTSGAWILGADFYCPAQDINLPYECMLRHAPVHAQQIISSIKTFRKEN
jgi:hypothetical protein